MNKTLIWIVVGILAVAGLSVVAVKQFGSRGEPALAASISPAAATSASSERSVPTNAAVASVPAASSDTAVAAAQPSATVPSATPTIDELIQNQALYEGRPIALRGTVLTQCTAGCEFALDDGTGVLSVQLEGKGKDRLIPLGKVGKKIEVHGVFRAAPRPQVVIEDPNGWQFIK